jgi:hypothetical protein
MTNNHVLVQRDVLDGFRWFSQGDRHRQEKEAASEFHFHATTNTTNASRAGVSDTQDAGKSLVADTEWTRRSPAESILTG